MDTDKQKLRDEVLRLALEYRQLVQSEALADNMIHMKMLNLSPKELKELCKASCYKLAELLTLVDHIIAGRS
jgi:hypothetical protein